jgi:hypothetical protein
MTPDSVPPVRDRSVAERRLHEADELARGAMPGAAVRPYRELLELEPEHVEGRLHLARLLDQLEEPAEAVEVLSEGLRRSRNWIFAACCACTHPTPRPSSSSDSYCGVAASFVRQL